MNQHNKTASFGQKGAGEQAVTLAQSLLTGKPLSRVKVKDRTPKLKPRTLPRFGRKEALDNTDVGTVACNHKSRKPWTFWLTMVAALVAGL